jgi:hypothetical protein
MKDVLLCMVSTAKKLKAVGTIVRGPMMLGKQGHDWWRIKRGPRK